MRRVAVIVVGLLLVAYLLTGVTQVGYDEKAVVRRFGRVVARPGPGLWVGLPWGLDRVDKIQVRSVRQLAVGFDPSDTNDAPFATPGQLLTGDQNLIDLKLVAEYSIDESDAGLDAYLANQTRVDEVLSREAETLAAEWVAARTVDDVLAGRAALTRHVSDRLTPRVQRQGLGVVVLRVSVEYLAAPTAVSDAFAAVNQAQTNVRTRRNQAMQEADRYRNDANSLANRLALEGQAYRTDKIAVAKADAEAFYARLDQYLRVKETNPDALAAIWREEVGKILAGLKDRGRIDVLDDHLGTNGLELHQFIPSKKK